MRIIINADDLGIGERENNATFDLMQRGVITSATILANGPALENATSRLQDFPDKSFGIHLCLTEFMNCSGREDLKPLLNEHGEFSANIRELKIDRRLQEAIYVEWCSQVDKLCSLDVNISHIDSHHHVHTIPALFPVLKKVQRKYEIRRVRATKNLYSKSYPASQLLLLKKSAWNMAMKWYHHTKMTDVFTSFADFLEIQNEDLPKHDSYELMVHPENEAFEAETEALRSDWQAQIGNSFELISYRDL